MANFWKNNKFLVTGGSGFFGSHLVKKMQERGANQIMIPRSKNFDLIKRENCKKVVQVGNGS